MDAIGANIDDFRLETKSALNKAAALDLHRIELGAVSGDIAAWNLSPSGRRHLARYSASRGLQLSALSADIQGSRWMDPASVDERVERTIQVLQMAADMDVPTVSTYLGAIASVEEPGWSDVALDALERVGEFAESRGRRLAVRASWGGGGLLAGLTRQVGCPAVQICLDPAALVMSGQNPLGQFEDWAARICLVHARDGSAGAQDHPGHETTFGQGEVDLRGVIHALQEVEYRGPYILRRHDSAAPLADIAIGRDTLTEWLGD